MGLSIASGEGSGTDLYLFSDFKPEMYIETLILKTDDGIETINDSLMIDQIIAGDE
jgi:hypothetical protein